MSESVGEFSGFAAHVKDAIHANAAQKEGVVADAVRALEVAHAELLAHLQRPSTLAQLHGCAPPLQEAVVKVVVGMFLVAGERLMVADGVRSEREQVELYAKGRTKPGKIVTHCDGVTRRSNHQVAVVGPWKGLGCAVDFAFLDAQGRPSWGETFPWRFLGALAKAQGLVWGGDWPTRRDRPHVELLA